MHGSLARGQSLRSAGGRQSDWLGNSGGRLGSTQLWCLALYAILQSLDLVTTAHGLSNGITVEANPLAASLLEHGLWLMLAAKALVVLAVALVVVRLSVRYRRLWSALWIGNGFYVLVVLINIWSLLP